MKRAAVTGGPALSIAATDRPAGLSWGEGGILYGERGSVMWVSPTGGDVVRLFQASDGIPVGAANAPGW